MIAQLLGYAPDADPTVIGVITNASRVVPSLRGMKGAPSPSSTPLVALDRTCQGAAVLAKLDGSTRFIAGTETKLQEAGVSTWTDVSAAATYSGGSTTRWRFAQQGNVSLAVNSVNTMQASVSTGAFSPIAGAPIASIVETVNQFVFAFNTSDNSDEWRCSALGDYTNWTASIATQAARGRLNATGGPLTGGRRFGDAIVAYKKNSMYLGIYVGPPLIWEFTLIPGTAGAMSQEAIVNVGTSENPKQIFMGEDDFYMYDGSKPVPIGTNRLKQTVFGQLLHSRYYACAAMHDRVNSLVYFYYPVADSPLPDHCVVYNYRTDKWGVDDRTIEAAFEYVTPGITYNSLGTLYSTYNDLPNVSYDLAFMNSAQPLPAFFSTTHRPRTLTGEAGDTSLTTGDIGDDSAFSTLTRVRMRFLTKPDSATMLNYYRNNTGDDLTLDTTTSLSSSNTFDVIRDARWHRFTFNMTGDWEAAVYVPEFQRSGSE